MWTKTGTWSARQSAHVTESEPVKGRGHARPLWEGGISPLNDADLESRVPARKPVSPAQTAEPGELNYSWEQWFSAYKEAAGSVNPSLAVNEKGGSIIDFMDKAPLKKVYLKNMCPRTMGRFFGAQFEI